MNKTTKAPENFFRLLVPATDVTPSDTPSVELCGRRWILTGYMPLSEAPPYTCISYSWGSGKVDNIFEGGQLMSYRTIPAIEAAIKASQVPEHWGYALICTPPDKQKEAEKLSAALKASQALWIDALCVPPRDPALSMCLQSMGAIYSTAAQVFAVLSEPCTKLLHKAHLKEHMNADDLSILDNDEWITRAWTYQEMANSKNTYFIAQNDDSVLILAQDFLNAISASTDNYADTEGFERAELTVRFSRLESLQVMMSEHSSAEFAGRSAYQVISAMHLRSAEREDDRIYAMIGTLTDLPSGDQNDATLYPAEYFMQVCEAKGDYSFIYCVAPRSTTQGKGWRPVTDKMQPVLSGLSVSGSGLKGYTKGTHLQLDNMCRMTPSRLNSVASSIGSFLCGNIPVAILKRLWQQGFTGCGEHIVLENGYFFPQSSFTRSKDLFVAASEDVQWTNGGPALLLRSNGTDINEFCDVGVFIGRLPNGGESINVA